MSEPRAAAGDVVIDPERRTREAVADALRRVGPPDTRPSSRQAVSASDTRHAPPQTLLGRST